MIRRINEIFNVTEEELDKIDIFNSFVGIDSLFYIDPSLLESTNIPELLHCREKILRHYKSIYAVISASTKEGDRFWKEGVKLFMARENRMVSLGHASEGAPGHGIGPAMANVLVASSKEIISKGISNPLIFEIVGVFQEGIGPDSISDFTIKIIFEELLAFSHRVVGDLKLTQTEYKYRNKVYHLPFNAELNKPVVLIPKSILRNIPVALDWTARDVVARYNDELRAEVNEKIGDTWRKAQSENKKGELRKILIEYPALFNDLIEQYEEKEKNGYDFINDPNGEVYWYSLLKKFFEYNQEKRNEKQVSDLKDIVNYICERCKSYFDSHNLDTLIWNGDKLRHERSVQLIFFVIADLICEINNYDISREPNAGRGPVDFKLSKGYNQRAVVEIKFSNNPKLKAGYLKQLQQYIISEKAKYAVYLIFLVRDEDVSKINELMEIKRQQEESGQFAPKIIVVNAEKKKSASKL